MALLLIGIGKRKIINNWLKADTSAIEKLKIKVSKFSDSIKRNPSLTDLMIIGVWFWRGKFCHFIAGFLAPYFKI